MFKNTLLIVISIALSGCVLPKALPEASTLSSSDSRVIVIGKFQLDPPINTQLEQKTHWSVIGDGQIINTIAMATGPELNPVNTNQLKGKEWQQYIKAEWGKTFQVQVPRRPTYLNGGMMQLDLMSSDRLWFPGGYYFDVPKDADAIYIGTLHYTRNDFNTITHMKVVDEYQSTLNELKKQHGNDIKLSKSLLKPAQ